MAITWLKEGNTKVTRVTVRRLRTKIQRIFCAQSSARISGAVWKWSEETLFTFLVGFRCFNLRVYLASLQLTASWNPSMGSRWSVRIQLFDHRWPKFRGSGDDTVMRKRILVVLAGHYAFQTSSLGVVLFISFRCQYQVSLANFAMY